MALIIKGNMPERCGYDCDLWSEGLCAPLQKSVDAHTIDSDCPIIGEIPDSHGRLIVADALLEKLDKIVLPDALTYTIARCILEQIIEDSETIVEATE